MKNPTGYKLKKQISRQESGKNIQATIQQILIYLLKRMQVRRLDQIPQILNIEGKNER